MDHESFLWKSNFFGQRTLHKKYVAKKQRYQQKSMGWEGIASSVDPFEFIPRSTESVMVWRIFEIHADSVWKYAICRSSQGESLRVSMKKGNPITDHVVMGDELVIENGVITGIVERKNLLTRNKGDNNRFSLHTRSTQSIASNLDYIIITASAKNPKFQPGFIDRYMLLAETAKIPVIICITKSDLLPIRDPILEWYEKERGIPVFHTSSVDGLGVAELRDFLAGKTVVFVGKSGVGKSSLTNAILGEDTMTVSDVSEKWGQWQHTTTLSKMHEWQDGSYVIDTPGIRSLEFFELQADELRSYFPEFVELSSSCEYRDCSHSREPKCGVKNAVRSKLIPELRYRTYLRILEEIR